MGGWREREEAAAVFCLPALLSQPLSVTTAVRQVPPGACGTSCLFMPASALSTPRYVLLALHFGPLLMSEWTA